MPGLEDLETREFLFLITYHVEVAILETRVVQGVDLRPQYGVHNLFQVVLILHPALFFEARKIYFFY